MLNANVEITPTITSYPIIPSPTMPPIISGVIQMPTISPTIAPFDQNTSTDSSGLSTSSADLINNVYNMVTTSQTLNNQIDAFLASTSALLSDSQASSSSQPVILDTNTSIPSTTLTGNDQTIDNLQQLTVHNLSVIESVSLPNTTISGNLMVDGTLVIANSSITTISPALYLSSSNLINFMEGMVTIDKLGNMNVEGILYAKKGIITDSITPIKDKITLYGPAEIKGKSELSDLSVMGTATFSGVISASKIDLTNTDHISSSSALTTPSDNLINFGVFIPGIKATGSAGSGILPAGQNQILIQNSGLSENTLIYITATSATDNKTLYIGEKKPGQYFTVSMESPSSHDIRFNWWIVN
jgi:hypothetical protein